MLHWNHSHYPNDHLCNHRNHLHKRLYPKGSIKRCCFSRYVDLVHCYFVSILNAWMIHVIIFFHVETNAIQQIANLYNKNILHVYRLRLNLFNILIKLHCTSYDVILHHLAFDLHNEMLLCHIQVSDAHRL